MPDRSGSPTTHRPILIVGANGSGTSLLRLMLDSHERIAIPQETGFLRLAMAHQWVPYWQLGDQWASHLDLTDEAMRSRLAEFYGGLFAEYAEARGKQRWGDKTPFHVWHLQLAAQLFPECQVIGIVRHPGAVVSSLRRRFRRTLSDATGHWRRWTSQLLHEAVSLGDRCIVLRYEDLVLDPEATMRAVLEWLGEPWSQAVLAHHEVQRSTGNEVAGFTRTDVAIHSDQVAEWEQHLRGNALAKVVERTGALAAYLGYRPDAASPLQPFGTDRPIMTGSELRERQGSHGAGIDWTKRPQPHHEDLPLRPPAPRPGKPGSASLDEVTIRDVLRHRLSTSAGSRLPAGARGRAHKLRRSHPWIDRLLGPR